MKFSELSKLERLERIKAAHRHNIMVKVVALVLMSGILLNSILLIGSEPENITVGYGIWWLCTFISWVVAGYVAYLNKDEWE